MLNRTHLLDLSRKLQSLKETVEALESYGIKAYWNNKKERPSPAENAETLKWMEETINSLFAQLRQLTEWHRNASKSNPSYKTTTPEYNWGDYWAWLERDLYAISERLVLDADKHQQRTDRYFYVANQLHALNEIDDQGELTQRQKEAYFSMIEGDYKLMKMLERLQQPRNKGKRG